MNPRVVILGCGFGGLFAARALGHPVLLYDGSFEDWSRRAELPVTNPAKP